MEYLRLQLSAVRKDLWDPDCGFLVAARSLYKVQFFTANQEVLSMKSLGDTSEGLSVMGRIFLPTRDQLFCAIR